jgi:hypothetical protein
MALRCLAIATFGLIQKRMAELVHSLRSVISQKRTG